MKMAIRREIFVILLLILNIRTRRIWKANSHNQ
jgi:hypothetical protein